MIHNLHNASQYIITAAARSESDLKGAKQALEDARYQIDRALRQVDQALGKRLDEV